MSEVVFSEYLSLESPGTGLSLLQGSHHREHAVLGSGSAAQTGFSSISTVHRLLADSLHVEGSPDELQSQL